MLSKACIVGAYQRKLEELAAEPDVELIVAMPPYWKDERGVTPLERAHTQGYDVEILPMAFNGRFHLHFYPRFARLVREHRPDVVHIDEEPYNLATFHANRIARRQGARTLWFSWQNLQRAYPWPFSMFERYNLRNVDYGIVGSRTAAEVWRAKGYEGALAVIPQFGVDPELFTPPETARPLSPVVLGYAGRLVPEKGVDLLLEALQGVGGEWRLDLFARGPEEARLRALAEHEALRERVVFHDLVPSVAMPEVYRSMDICILPSRTRSNWTEQFGRVLIEAMAAGVAVVGAESGEIPYVIGDAGLTFKEDDRVGLEAALNRLVSDASLRRDLGARGRARVLAHFTQRRVATATANVYREMMG
jgi:glycosyltransferase involved in cell wall biosynthesis